MPRNKHIPDSPLPNPEGLPNIAPPEDLGQNAPVLEEPALEKVGNALRAIDLKLGEIALNAGNAISNKVEKAKTTAANVAVATKDKAVDHAAKTAKAAKEMASTKKEEIKLVAADVGDGLIEPSQSRRKIAENIRTSVPSKGRASETNPYPEAPKATRTRTRFGRISKGRQARRASKRSDKVLERTRTEELANLGAYQRDGSNDKSRRKTRGHVQKLSRSIDKTVRKDAKTENGDDLLGKGLKIAERVGLALGGRPSEDISEKRKVPMGETEIEKRFQRYRDFGVEVGDHHRFDELHRIRLDFFKKILVDQRTELARNQAAHEGRELSELEEISLSLTKDDPIIVAFEEQAAQDASTILNDEANTAEGAAKFRRFQEATQAIFSQRLNEERQKLLYFRPESSDVPEIVKSKLLKEADQIAMAQFYSQP